MKLENYIGGETMFETYNPYSSYNQYYGYNQQPRQIQTYRTQPSILQGKVVDSLDVVKATDIPYDGSVSYFPLTDSSAIITKQLQPDGTTKVVIYKPDIGGLDITPKYMTEEDFDEKVKDINSKDLKEMKEDIKTLKRKLEDITDDMRYKKEK